MSIARNYIYNIIYQVFIILVPLITVPYISRVLGSNGIGVYAYTNSIVQYFVLFGTIGVALYGNRAIAYTRDNKEEMSRTFWGIFVLKVVTTSIMYGFFLLFLLIVSEYEIIFFIQSIYIISAALDITWLYMGLEDFKKTVIRNIFVKTIGMICIFLFVKEDIDLWKYVLILGLSELIGQLSMWAYLPKTVKKIQLKWGDISKHFFPSIGLFIPQIAIQIYLVLNKTMLGLLGNTNEVGYFDNADKIVKLVLAVVTSMGIVMLPRVSNTFARGNMKKVNQYVYQSFEFSSYLSIPMMFGLAATAPVFTPWFFGEEFLKTGTLIGLLSPIIVFIAWSNVIGQQFLLPIGRVRAYTVSVTVGAVINFIVNLLLIPNNLSVGAAIATLIAEFMVTLVQFIIVCRRLEISQLFIGLWKYFVSGLIMYGVIRWIGESMKISMMTTFVQIISGVFIYFSVLFIFRSRMNQYIFRKLRDLLILRH